MEYRTNRKRDKDGFLYQDRAVLDLLLQGKSRPEICEALNMPRGTLNTCCNRIYRKMDVTSVVELILKCGPGQTVYAQKHEEEQAI